MTISKNKTGAVRRFDVVTRSSEETKRLGKSIGRHLGPGDIVALDGELGAGKTTFVKGLASALGINEADVSSPTFVLINEYHGRQTVYHMDWYRLDAVEGADREEALERFDAGGVSVVEWAARGRPVFSGDVLHVEIEHKGASDRRVKLWAEGKRYDALFDALKGLK